MDPGEITLTHRAVITASGTHRGDDIAISERSIKRFHLGRNCRPALGNTLRADVRGASTRERIGRLADPFAVIIQSLLRNFLGFVTQFPQFSQKEESRSND